MTKDTITCQLVRINMFLRVWW